MNPEEIPGGMEPHPDELKLVITKLTGLAAKAGDIAVQLEEMIELLKDTATPETLAAMKALLADLETRESGLDDLHEAFGRRQQQVRNRYN